MPERKGEGLGTPKAMAETVKSHKGITSIAAGRSPRKKTVPAKYEISEIENAQREGGGPFGPGAKNSGEMETQGEERIGARRGKRSDIGSFPRELRSVVKRTRLDEKYYTSKWGDDEQRKLDAGLKKYSSLPPLQKYILIAATLPNKGVRDVAMRAVWQQQQQDGAAGRKRKGGDAQATKKRTQPRTPRDAPNGQQSIFGGRPPLGGCGGGLAPPPPSSTVIDLEDHGSGTVGSLGGQPKRLLDSNAQLIQQVRSNMASCRIQENTEILTRYRDNILAVLEGINSAPGMCSGMPPLPVKLDHDLSSQALAQSGGGSG